MKDVIIALIGLAGLLGSAYVGSQQRAAAAARVGPQKVCRVVIPGESDDKWGWSDSITVPPTWTRDICEKFQQSVGAHDYELGCASEKGFAWGRNIGHQPPEENTCDW